jgi:hypothetical protein
MIPRRYRTSAADLDKLPVDPDGPGLEVYVAAAQGGQLTPAQAGEHGVQGLVPGRQESAGRGIEAAAAGVVPLGWVGVVVADVAGGWPPDLVIAGGDGLPQLGAGEGAADGDVDVRGKAALRLDRGEVLDVVAEEAAQVLDQPVEQPGEVQGVAGRAGVVVGGRVGWA